MNCHTRIHRDSNNHSFVPNYIIPLSCFNAGELWLEHEQGEVYLDNKRGHLLPIQLPYVTFDPKIRHATMPWRGVSDVEADPYQRLLPESKKHC